MLASSSRSREGKSMENQSRTVSSRMQQRLASSRALQSNSRAQAKDSRTQEAAATGSSSKVQANNSIKTLLIKGRPVGSRERNKLQLVVGQTWPTNSSRGRNLKSQRSREIEVRK